MAKGIPKFHSPFAKSLEDYAARSARWAMHSLGLGVDDATALVNAFPTVVERAWNKGESGFRPEPQSVSQAIVSHVRWLAETDQAEGKMERSAALNKLYFFLAFPRLRKRKATMPKIP